MTKTTPHAKAASFLGDLSPAEFMRDYWQKKPLLVRDAVPGFATPLAPEELAGLACEQGVTSRIVQERGGDYPWQVRYGPFDEADFTSLPATHYSLLVQEVDRLVPEVAGLLECVSFLPNWTLDDVMVSYAPENGSVGAHVDSYDVFLLQGLGHRRWQIGSKPVIDEHYVPDLDVRILADFEPDHEWVLGPGDMLYLPPRVPHYGTAEDDCMTYSIGCRAPSAQELAVEFMAHLAEIEEPDLYRSAERKPVDEPGALDEATVESMHAFLSEYLRREASDRDAFSQWIGEHLTRPARGHPPVGPGGEYTSGNIRELLHKGKILQRSAPPHFAHRRRGDGAMLLFVGGETYAFERKGGLEESGSVQERGAGQVERLVPILTGREELSAETLGPLVDDDTAMELLADLLERGYLWHE